MWLIADGNYVSVWLICAYLISSGALRAYQMLGARIIEREARRSKPFLVLALLTHTCMLLDSSGKGGWVFPEINTENPSEDKAGQSEPAPWTPSES